jgi:hypothetical protein
MDADQLRFGAVSKSYTLSLIILMSPFPAAARVVSSSRGDFFVAARQKGKDKSARTDQRILSTCKVDRAE